MRALVVGASAAGLRAATTLVGDYPGDVTVLAAEHTPPYDRTAVSKGILTGALSSADVTLEVPSAVELRQGIRALGLDLAQRQVVTDSGPEFFDHLVLATGARPLVPPGWLQLSGTHALRTAADAEALRDHLANETEVVVIGAGVLGLEVATGLSALGHQVTVVEGAPRPLSRVLPPQLSAEVLRYVAERGIRLLCGVEVLQLEGEREVNGVRLADGTLVPASVVVLALGSRPNDDWLTGSGLTTRAGVMCNEYLGAGPGDVFAAGDVARYPRGPGIAGTTRCEHWTRAGDQGAYVAKRLLGEDAGPFRDVPYMWSDLLGTRLQVVGQLAGDESVFVRQGERSAVLVRSGRGVTGAATFGWQRLASRLRGAVAQTWPWADALELLPREG